MARAEAPRRLRKGAPTTAVAAPAMGAPAAPPRGLVGARHRSPTAPAAPDLLGAAPELDRLIHERLRLGIVSALAVNESLSFNDLKHLLRTTDGNLSVHARKLEEAGYVTCDKHFEGRLPKTEYRLAPAGRQALKRYLEYMEALIHATRGA